MTAWLEKQDEDLRTKVAEMVKEEAVDETSQASDEERPAEEQAPTEGGASATPSQGVLE